MKQRNSITRAALRSAQQPVKDRYRSEPSSASITLGTTAVLEDGVSCSVETKAGVVIAGLHPGTGGDGSQACSGDMLLEALAACAGVTLLAVATSMELAVRSGKVRVEGDLDWRGTLGMSREIPVGFTEVRLHYELDTDATDQQLERLVQSAERYCVVYQTLGQSPSLQVSITRTTEPLPANP